MMHSPAVKQVKGQSYLLKLQQVVLYLAGTKSLLQLPSDSAHSECPHSEQTGLLKGFTSIKSSFPKVIATGCGCVLDNTFQGPCGELRSLLPVVCL